MEHLCCSEVSISPLFRWPNSVCHFKQIGEHTWLIEKAGIVIHKCPRNPFTGNRIFALSCGDNQFGQDFTLYEALRTVDRLLRGQSFIKQTDL
ncbi:DUF4761 family protein [Shigella boydii]|uniref:DUF4761 family protein n=1 Tax=Shigella boydii TaxID=621 RepID=UPI003CFB4302